MPKVAVYNIEGQQVGERELRDEIFGVPINGPLLHQAVQVYLANQRQRTQSVKTRADKRGGGRKPWRQKGTGRARHGSIRSPQWTGGGVVFAPKPRDYTQKFPRKMRKQALLSALSSKAHNNEIVVLDSLTMERPKTAFIHGMLKNLKVKEKALIVVKGGDEVVIKSIRNIPDVKAAFAGSLNVYDILKYDTFLITEEALKEVEEVYGK